MNTSESRSDTFAATPPLKFVRLILSWAASYKPKRANVSMIIAVFEISVSFFHRKVRKVIHVAPPKDLHKKVKIWRLLKSLYGTRDASQWRKDSTIMAFREMRWGHVCTGAQCWKHLVCARETISSLAFQMKGRTISNN